jgi:hypothetical protein
LKKYEKAASKIIQIEDGEEPAEFWNLWGYDKEP